MLSSFQRHYLLGGIFLLYYLKKLIPCSNEPINQLLQEIISNYEIRKYVKYDPLTDHFYLPLEHLDNIPNIKISKKFCFAQRIKNTPLHWLINLNNFEFWLVK